MDQYRAEMILSFLDDLEKDELAKNINAKLS